MGKCEKMKKEIILPVLGIFIGELMILFNQLSAGLAIYIFILQAIVLFLIFGKAENEIKNLHQAFLLVLQIRIINLAMPQLFTVLLLWYPLIYGVMLIPIYYVVMNQKLTSQEMGLNFDSLHIYLPSAFIIGTAAGLVEYIIIHPAPLIRNIQLSNLILISLIMYVFVGATEELIFRSILQTRLENVLGLNYGFLLSGVLYGIMFVGQGMVIEILFAVFFGIVLGYFFQKTRSLPFVLTVHGTANVILFGVLPIIIQG